VKRIITSIMLAAVIGCGAPQEEVSVTRAALGGSVAPPRPYGPLISGNLPGYTTLGALGPEVPLRPNLGYPGWISSVFVGAGFPYPPSQCPHLGSAFCFFETPAANDGLGHIFTPGTSRVGYGLVEFWSIDRHWPYNSTAVNAWANEVPLRSPSSAVNSPYYGPAFVVSDIGPSHMNDTGASPGTQMTYMLMDFYARVRLCDNPNLVGPCRDYGFMCQLSGGICHGDTACERDPNCTPRAGLTDIDISAYTQTHPHFSMDVRYPMAL
jgi:hypothetical protein